jgi:hypothetical protein
MQDEPNAKPITWKQRVWGVVRKSWRPSAGALLPLMALVVVVAFPDWLRTKAAFVESHLPLSLPILMVAVSIGVRLNELRSSQGWLRLCNHFASGFVTFAIWALVSGESVKRYIWINEEKVLDKSFAVPLVIAAFGLLAVCSIATVLAEGSHDPGDKTVWRAVQAVFVGVSFFALLFPYVLFEQKATVEARTGRSLEVQSFTVSVGYRDAALNQHLGRSANPIQQCMLYKNVAAKTLQQAKEVALKTFLESDVSDQFAPSERGKDRTSRKVESESSWVVAESAEIEPSQR